MASASTLIVIAQLLFAGADAGVGDWPQFRGPHGNGVVDQAHPQTWAADRNVVWTADVPGGGWSSPVVVGDRIIVTTAVGRGGPKGFSTGAMDPSSFTGGDKKAQAPLSFEVHCLNRRDGSTMWKKVVENKAPGFPIHASNTYATESPVSDGRHVVVYFGGIGAVACYDLDGAEKWRADVGAYPTSAGFGTGSSLALSDGHVFLQCDNQENSFLVAMDLATGKEAWRVPRQSSTSWSTPIVWRNAQRTELVVCGSGHVMSYDPSDGKMLWRLENIDSSFSASPATDRERIYFGNSGPMSSGPLVAVKAGASGILDLNKVDTVEHIAWSQRKSGPGLASPVAHDGFLYVVSRGILSCYHTTTGERAYRERLPDAGSIAASPWISQGRLFILDESGKTFMVKLGLTFELLGTNQLDGLFWSTPSVANGALFLRGADKLYCIGGK